FAASVFGPDRLVFGSDFGCPGENMVQPLLFKSHVEELSIDHMEKQKILGGNLADLLKIKVPPAEEENVKATPTSPSL
ncbi:MAG: amidohydrolase, partial [Thaumarchaeota archaeon]|nr:amidohydrolase [Nitrososphaerota archaeon]